MAYNNPVKQGERGWPQSFGPTLFDKRPGYNEADMIPMSELNHSTPKEIQPKPKSCSQDRHLTSPSDGRERTLVFKHFLKG